MEFTTAHLHFVKSTAQLIARTMINNFNQLLKREFNKISHILMGSEYFYPEISSQIKYKFVLRKNPTKHCARNNENLRFSKSINNIL